MFKFSIRSPDQLLVFAFTENVGKPCSCGERAYPRYKRHDQNVPGPLNRRGSTTTHGTEDSNSIPPVGTEI